MLSDIRTYYGLTREISLTGQSTYFETAQSQHVVRELKLAIREGKLIVLAGIVGTGKTTMLRKIQDALEEDKEKEILVAKSLSVDGGQISLGTLILALFCDLTTAKDDPMPTQAERRERALRALVRKRKKPVALFIDDAHQLHPKTLVGLKRLMEIVRDGKGTLSVVLAGHPKLKNDLLRPSMEEIGARTTLFELDGFGTDRKKYLQWLIGQVTAPRTKLDTLLTEAAVALLCERLTTPLQFELYLTRAFEEAFRIGQKPVDADTVEAILAPDLDGLEARLTRNGYNAKVLTELLGAKPREVRAFLGGHLAPERTQELHDSLLAAGVPL
ncbi:AAA family ATPase [Ralstonia solanacearum]|uniref:ExeA family protein n=1 Tax=Ralstonia solanacearum TaxID=305 RepID=UPI0005C7818E|nr:AAA family ATPase [Ralstonia solanacearum]MDB0544252.1 AAA family ATPase [Ralstonia solanacearum]MDB0554120.1 AAA family ATPase [Ralstonia solanacearum]MDB0559175.1 AAA family ATPase [Ralstonia solanacearum]